MTHLGHQLEDIQLQHMLHFACTTPEQKKTSNNQGSEKQTFQLTQNIEASQSMQINNTVLRCESNLFFYFHPGHVSWGLYKTSREKKKNPQASPWPASH
jgi:hypothetical protein